MFGKNRVEEDLERIRVSNLLPEQYSKYNRVQKNKTKENLYLEKNDVLAMILAIFSLVLPYVLFFIIIMLLVVSFMYYFYL